jgi:beta-aspartyl-peptidase (threonine type)
MKPVLAIHGGAGTIATSTIARCRKALREALAAGYEILDGHGASLDAVTAVVVILEDSGLFNAGRGGARNTDGKVELDASIMDGQTLLAGGVACVTRIRNPILAARTVMERSKHVLLAGSGAERFSHRHGFSSVTQKYFLQSRKTVHGTVGAVALDREGNLAAATSTGGYDGKLPGRVGDSPLIGAGTYADNRSCAVSCTGIGEYFIRSVAAHDVSARVLHRKISLSKASTEVMQNVGKLKGRGGLIAVDRRGEIAMPYNSRIMYRGCVTRAGRLTVEV